MKHLHMSGISFSHSRPIHVALEERNRVKNTHTHIHTRIHIYTWYIHTYVTLRTHGSMTEPLKVQCLDIDKEPLKGLNGTILKVPQAEPLKVQN